MSYSKAKMHHLQFWLMFHVRTRWQNSALPQRKAKGKRGRGYHSHRWYDNFAGLTHWSHLHRGQHGEMVKAMSSNIYLYDTQLQTAVSWSGVIPNLNLRLSETYRKIFFFSEQFCPGVQNLKLNSPQLRWKIRGKIVILSISITHILF